MTGIGVPIAIQRMVMLAPSITRLMGCTVELMIDGPATLVPRAFERLRKLEQVWTRFSPTSELNRLHQRAGTWTHVSDDLFRALSWCDRLSEETGGLFDPTIRAALESWGYDRTFADIDRGAPAPQRSQPAPGPHAIELDRPTRRVRLNEGASVDLGGIGKGLGADIIAAELIAAGARGVYACLGGDIHVDGESPDGGWPVPLLHPLTGAVIAHHQLSDGGLVMSTTAIRRWTRDGVAAHHLIDPRRGAPTDTDLIAVAVAARSSARAEALAKAAIVAGSVKGRDLLERCDVTAWMVLEHEIITLGVR